MRVIEKNRKNQTSLIDKEFGPIGSELYKSIVKAVSDDDYEMPSFAKYYITVYKFGHHYLIDSRDGKVHHLTGDINNDPNIVGDIVGQSISILFNQNSNVVISITKDDSICQINYSKWDGSKLKIFDKQRIFSNCSKTKLYEVNEPFQQRPHHQRHRKHQRPRKLPSQRPQTHPHRF